MPMSTGGFKSTGDLFDEWIINGVDTTATLTCKDYGLHEEILNKILVGRNSTKTSLSEDKR
jgi:hypothetical protein